MANDSHKSKLQRVNAIDVFGENRTLSVKLESSDNQVFEVDLSVALCSVLIRTKVEQMGAEEWNANQPILLPGVNSTVLQKVIAWATYHQEEESLAGDYNEDGIRERRSDEISAWDEELLNVDKAMLFDIGVAANYLEIPGLVLLICKKVANMITGKTEDELRTTFELANDLTSDEEDQIRRENEWCEEKTSNGNPND